MLFIISSREKSRGTGMQSFKTNYQAYLNNPIKVIDSYGFTFRTNSLLLETVIHQTGFYLTTIKKSPIQ